MESWQDMKFLIKRSQKNHVHFIINDEIVYERRFNSELFKKKFIYLLGEMEINTLLNLKT